MFHNVPLSIYSDFGLCHCKALVHSNKLSYIISSILHSFFRSPQSDSSIRLNLSPMAGSCAVVVADSASWTEFFTSRKVASSPLCFLSLHHPLTWAHLGPGDNRWVSLSFCLAIIPWHSQTPFLSHSWLGTWQVAWVLLPSFFFCFFLNISQCSQHNPAGRNSCPTAQRQCRFQHELTITENLLGLGHWQTVSFSLADSQIPYADSGPRWILLFATSLTTFPDQITTPSFAGGEFLE